MSDKTVNLKYAKSTKGTHVYTDGSADAIIPTLYIKHGAFNNSVAPAALTVTVSTRDGS